MKRASRDGELPRASFLLPSLPILPPSLLRSSLLPKLPVTEPGPPDDPDVQLWVGHINLGAPSSVN